MESLGVAGKVGMTIERNGAYDQATSTRFEENHPHIAEVTRRGFDPGADIVPAQPPMPLGRLTR